MRKIFIDGGGYTGSSVQKFISAFEGFEIFSFEPNPHLKAYHDKLPNTLIEAAIWVEDGTIDFFLDCADYDGSSVFEHKMYIENKQKITVRCIDFSQWISQQFDPRDLIILKLDIEGAEYRVLDKMIADGTIDYIDELLIEFHWHKIGMDKQVHEALLRRLKAHHIVPVDWNAINWERPQANNHDLVYLKAKYPSLVRRPSAAVNSAPLVSVLMSVHNCPAYVQRAMESIYQQTYGNLEFIIIDDASTDQTPAILERFKDARTRIYRNPSNLGLTKSLNIGLKLCRGKYVARMDADDISLPQRLAKQVEFLESHPDIAVVGSAYYRIDAADKPFGRREVPVDDAAIRRMLQRTCAFGHGTVMARREAILTCGGYDERFIYAQDFDLWLRMSERYKLANLPEPLYCWRSTPECISNRVRDQQRAFHEAALQQARMRAAARAKVRPSAMQADLQQAHAEFAAGRWAAAQQLVRLYYARMDYNQLPMWCSPDRPVQPMFSVIIVTYNRPQEVLECCRILRGQPSSASYEVLVVDNGNARQNAAAAKEIADVYIDCPVNLYASEGRNIGAVLARGQILVFLDDDAIVGPDYLNSIGRAFEQYEILGLRGKVLPKHGSPPTTSTNYDLGDTEMVTLSTIEGNNAFRRDAYLAVGGMDPLLFGHEGGEFNWRLIQKYNNPAAVIYWPQAVIYHDYGDAGKSEEKKWRYSQNNEYIKHKHGLMLFHMKEQIDKQHLRPTPKGQRQVCAPAAVEATASTPPLDVTSTCSSGSVAASDPKVSVVMSCHNAAAFLAETMDSLLAQTMTDWELLAIDDGSTDETTAILRAYAENDKRIRFWRFDDKKGPYVRRNFAIAQAQSDFISIQDADDIAVPQKLRIFYKEMSANQHLGILGSFYRRFWQTFRGADFGDRMDKAITHEQIMQLFPRTWHVCWHGSALIRKDLFDAIGLYDEQPYGSDTFWLSKAGLYGYLTGKVQFANLPLYLTYKREHAHSQTGTINPVDPRSRRHRLETYYLRKLAGIMEKARANPALDVAAELRQCTCTDFIPLFGARFAEWESQPVDQAMCRGLIDKAIAQFAAEQYVSCLITLNALEQMTAAKSLKWRNLNLTRGLAAYAGGDDAMALAFLKEEARLYGHAAAQVMVQRLEAGRVPAEAWLRRKEIRDYITQAAQSKQPQSLVLSDFPQDDPAQMMLARQFLDGDAKNNAVCGGQKISAPA